MTILLFVGLGIICFVLAALGIKNPSRINLTALGLAFWLMTVLLRTAYHIHY